MRCCGKLEAFFLGLVLSLAVCAAHASDIVADSAQLVAGGDGTYSLAADFTTNLNRRLEQAVNKGVVLYFVADFELTRPLWYWFDQTVVQRSKTFQLSYHALARQYRLSSGVLHQSFYSLDEALQVLSHLRHWQVIEKGEIVSDADYVARTRLRLDPSLMAKTFQVSALSNRDWNQSSGWLLWNFSSHEIALPAPAATSRDEETK
ncbi:hypothetical protein AGMMS50256_00320 [Betaproteobacteria bacterium]|nr:hypothetical protein AGMMS50256_00320 [Betaproteobacteria bacterium]